MYGTIARMRLRPGMEQRFREIEAEASDEIPGFLFSHMYRMDADPNEYMRVVAFADRESYVRNARSPEQHQRYLRYRELLEADPEWHDGEIAFSIEQ